MCSATDGKDMALGGRPPQAASTASGNLAACAVPSTIIGTDGSRVSFSATATPTAVCGSMKRPVSRSKVRMVAAVSSSSARSAENTARISESARAERTKRCDWASEAIRLRTARPSRA